MGKIVFKIELFWFIARKEFLNTFKEEESEVRFTFMTKDRKFTKVYKILIKINSEAIIL